MRLLRRIRFLEISCIQQLCNWSENDVRGHWGDTPVMEGQFLSVLYSQIYCTFALKWNDLRYGLESLIFITIINFFQFTDTSRSDTYDWILWLTAVSMVSLRNINIWHRSQLTRYKISFDTWSSLTVSPFWLFNFFAMSIKLYLSIYELFKFSFLPQKVMINQCNCVMISFWWALWILYANVTMGPWLLYMSVAY